MKHIEVNEYNYQELKDAVLRDPSEENIEALGEWFEQYGDCYWNGETWNADDFHIAYTYDDEYEYCTGFQIVW